jgi:5-methylcytosine-specific restriction endonuclease McrA
MSHVSASVRQRVRDRAGNRCEYCLSHQNYLMGILQVDHVQPVSKGGTDSEDNLCLACEFCNQYKWAKTEAIDPKTEFVVVMLSLCLDLENLIKRKRNRERF